MLDLLSWAEFEFQLNKTDENGISEREHLQQVKRQLGYTPEALENPNTFPNLLMYIWVAFCDLSGARSAGFSGPNPLSYSEIKAWKELTGTPLSIWDIRVLKRLDQQFIKVSNG